MAKANAMSRFTIRFADHLSEAYRGSFTDTISAFGLATEITRDHISLDIFRASKVERLRNHLSYWKSCGYLTWTEAGSSKTRTFFQKPKSN
jgi:hypothetical protein